jgi:chromate transport protein ChrA
MARSYPHLLQLSGLVISSSGLVLMAETGRALHANMMWLGARVVTQPRFILYAWVALLVACLLIVRGFTTALDRSAAHLIVRGIESGLELTSGVLLIVVVRGWRIRTDFAPLDRIETADGLPLILQFFMRWPVLDGVILIIAAVAVKLFWDLFRKTSALSS